MKGWGEKKGRSAEFKHKTNFAPLNIGDMAREVSETPQLRQVPWKPNAINPGLQFLWTVGAYNTVNTPTHFHASAKPCKR